MDGVADNEHDSTPEGCSTINTLAALSGLYPSFVAMPYIVYVPDGILFEIVPLIEHWPLAVVHVLGQEPKISEQNSAFNGPALTDFISNAAPSALEPSEVTVPIAVIGLPLE